MGLFEKVFGGKQTIHKNKQYFKMLTGYSPAYTNYNGSVYEMLQTKSIINTIATDCGKAIPNLTKHNKELEYMLQFEPNEFMNTPQFIERIVTNYLCDNNAYIIPITDRYDRIIGLYPIQYSVCEIVEYNGELYLTFEFDNGQKGAIEYSRVGKLVRHQYKNDIYGDNNDALRPTLELLHAQKETLRESLKNSGSIRFMGKIRDQLISKEHVKKERDEFVELNFGSNNGQMIIYDDRYEEIKQIDSNPVYLDRGQQELIDDNICAYFGVSKKVIKHEFSNDYEWNTYYESVIEPILIKLGIEITRMLYSKPQIMNGNKVIFSANRLQYMSTQSKLEFSNSAFDRGVITQNDYADVWQLPHFDDGDKHYIRREYAEINKLDDEVVLDPIDEGGESNGN